MDETTGHKVKKENPNRSKKTRPNVAPPDEVVITDDEANNDRETGELPPSPKNASESHETEQPVPDPIDVESRLSHFAWITFTISDDKTIYIPCLFREGKEYCSVRILVRQGLLRDYLNNYNHTIFNYAINNVTSYYVTEAESKLLNDINEDHCEGQFGSEKFTEEDVIIKLEDVQEYYRFLQVCYHKLQSKDSTWDLERCGFVRFNDSLVVPFVVKEDVKYLPLFYFEGSVPAKKYESFGGWEASYLKFCCKLQGIRERHFANEKAFLMIELSEVVRLLGAETKVEEFWPKDIEHNFLKKSNDTSVRKKRLWLKPPGADQEETNNNKTDFTKISKVDKDDVMIIKRKLVDSENSELPPKKRRLDKQQKEILHKELDRYVDSAQIPTNDVLTSVINRHYCLREKNIDHLKKWIQRKKFKLRMSRESLENICNEL